MHPSHRKSKIVNSLRGMVPDDTVIVFALLLHQTLLQPLASPRKTLWLTVTAFWWVAKTALLTNRPSWWMTAGRSLYSCRALNSGDRFLLHDILCSWILNSPDRGWLALVSAGVDHLGQHPWANIFHFLEVHFQISTMPYQFHPVSLKLCRECCTSLSCNQISMTSHSNY